MRRAVDRVMTQPSSSVVRTTGIDGRDVTVSHLYTPAERGQILAFIWWTYVNRAAWPRRKLRAAVTALSPLLLFSSTFLAEMSGMPSSTVTKCMVKPPGAPVGRVTGSCDMWVVHQILTVSAGGLQTYRDEIRELTLTKGVPKALMARLSGVPMDGLTRPERGVQFFPEEPDLSMGVVCTQAQCDAYWRMYGKERRRRNAPEPGDQQALRGVFAGRTLDEMRATHAPLPSEGELPYYRAIPGLPALRNAARMGPRYFERVRDWEFKYHLSASPTTGDQ